MGRAAALWARAQAEGTPVLDAGGATFVWRGRGPVSVAGDFHDWRGAPLPLARVGPGLWARRLALPPDAYVEYALLDGKGRRVADPLNPRTSDNGFGDHNHCFHMPQGGPTPLARRGRGVPRGKVTRHRLETHEWAVGATREVRLYAPPGEGPVPLVVVLDGQDYLRRVDLPAMVDALVHQGRMRPVALALVWSEGASRTVEYTCSDATVALLLQRVLPLAREHLPLLDERRRPGVHGVLGSSYGGLMALHAALRAPHVFGRVLSLSGAFDIPGHTFPVFTLAGLPAGRHPLTAWLTCGAREVLLEGNRRMAPLLAASGHRVQAREYNAGHNYPAWQGEVWRGLEFLFPPARR